MEQPKLIRNFDYFVMTLLDFELEIIQRGTS